MKKAAQEELARLQAITPEDDVPLMVLPATRLGDRIRTYYLVSDDMRAHCTISLRRNS